MADISTATLLLLFLPFLLSLAGQGFRPDLPVC